MYSLLLAVPFVPNLLSSGTVKGDIMKIERTSSPDLSDLNFNFPITDIVYFELIRIGTDGTTDKLRFGSKKLAVNAYDERLII